MQAAVARAQSLTIEAAQTVGYSTEDVGAVATQARLFGVVGSDVRFMVEGSWADRSDTTSDVFGAAYPYDGTPQLMEAYGERMFQPGRGLVGIRAGRYRTPFGIYSASDHAYVGFLRAPLIRYDNYYALSNNFLEQGADVVVGTPRAFMELSVGSPADVGQAQRRSGVDTVLHAQTAFGSAIVGMSYIDTKPYQSPEFAFGRAAFTGVDARWMRSGVQLRGEWLWGRPFDGVRTRGGYLDLIVHRPSMGAVTALARAERLAYDAPAPFALYTNRYTAGAKVRLFERFTAEVGVVHQTTPLPGQRATALDAAITYTFRHQVTH
jgi:hypothetical protein